MTAHYHVEYDDPETTITERPDGEWARWYHARQAAILHVEEYLAGCEEALWVLRRSPTFEECQLNRGVAWPDPTPPLGTPMDLASVETSLSEADHTGVPTESRRDRNAKEAGTPRRQRRRNRRLCLPNEKWFSRRVGEAWTKAR